MKNTNVSSMLVVILTAEVLILGGSSLSFTSVEYAIGQMMGSGMMGNGGMMGSGMINSNTVTNMTVGTKVPAGISVSIVDGAATMGDRAFQPNPLTIKVGNTVSWTNADTVMHTITSGSGPNDQNEGKQFNSGLLAEGQVVTYTFRNAGEFDYFCLIHPDMIGKVIVK